MRSSSIKLMREGDTVPTMSDRFTMAIGGLRQRFGASSGRPSSVIVPLAAATAFSLFYFSVIAWSPGIRYPGAVGPFTNPSVVVAVIFVAALILAVFRREVAARSLALFAGAGVEIAIAILAGVFDWLGPSLPTAVLVAGLGVVAALPWRGRIAIVVSLACLVALTGFILGADIVGTAAPGADVPIAVFQILVLFGVAVSVAIAARRAARFEEHLGRA